MASLTYSDPVACNDLAVLLVNVRSATLSIGCRSTYRTLSFSWQVRMVQQAATVPTVVLQVNPVADGNRRRLLLGANL